MTRRWPIVVLSLAAVLTTGCQAGEPAPRPACDCPNSEAVVSSIDWLGDGLAAEMFSSSESFEGPWPGLGLTFTRFDTLTEAQVAVDSLYNRLQAAELVEAEPIPPGEPNLPVGLDLEGATVFIPPPLVDPDSQIPEPVENPLYLCIEVEVVAGDARAAEALQPLVDALGTID